MAKCSARGHQDTLFEIIDHLPQEAAEALLSLAAGETPEASVPAPAAADPFSHPDAQRRFRVLTNVEELERALDFPWEKWAVFLHPGQRRLVERLYTGPARVSGSAGTGKTIVALHRAVALARRYLTGDLGQRIFQQPFSWKSLGVDIRSRSYTLRINYRTSHQIRSCADRLLPPALADVDGNTESRRGTISVSMASNPLSRFFRR
jgi:hypothetical protein